MKATKIMGAVLGVLLVAALFTGAAAAATNVTSTVFVYQADPAGINTGINYYLMNEHGDLTATSIQAVKVDGKVAFTGMNLIEGIYTDGSVSFALKYPTINLSGTVNAVTTATPVVVNGATEPLMNATYNLADSSVVRDFGTVTINVAPVSAALNSTNVSYILTDPTMSKRVIDSQDASGQQYIYSNGTITINVHDEQNPSPLKTLKKGTWSIQPFFNTGFVSTTPDEVLYGELVSFNVIEKDDEFLTASADSLVVGDSFQVTVHGIPGVYYYFANNANGDVAVAERQKDVVYDTSAKRAFFRMPANGVFEISLDAKKDVDDLTIELGNKQASNDVELVISIDEGSITASAEKDVYIIGQNIKLVGTSTITDDLYIYVEGTNIPFKYTDTKVGGDSEWEKKIEWNILTGSSALDKKLDAGTYTFYVSNYPYNATLTSSAEELKKAVKAKTYATAPVTLKQSFIKLTDMPEVVAQGEKFTAEGSADACDAVLWYLFGTNYFEAGVEKVKSDDSFKISIDKEFTGKEMMAAGQYFLVVQHPMYDKVFSIAPEGMGNQTFGWSTFKDEFEVTPEYNILELTKAGVYEIDTTDSILAETDAYNNATKLFATSVRQTANAAQALCDALDSQNFDDMYVKASFVVAAAKSEINPIPTQITKGELLTVSGQTTGYVGEMVTFEITSTAFAALPKETVGTAAFTTLTTKVNDDGTWSITFDTSNLNADDYTCSVAVADLGATIAQIKVVDGAGPQPTQTTPVNPTAQPTTQPTATPATPGFGALAALAGLGAVAVLLLRRQ